MRVVIRGWKWIIRSSRRRLKNMWGWCDSDKRTIVLCRTLKGRRHLDTVIHELLHAAFYDLDEEAVRESATDIANVLWRMGYRR